MRILPMRIPKANKLTALFVLAICVAPAFAANPRGADVLDNARRQIRAYLEQISDVRCTEHVQQLKLNKKGGTEYKVEATFDYLVLMEGSNDQFLLNESRLPQGHKGKVPQHVSMLVSNGFSDLFLILHPYYQNSFEFDDGQEQMVDGQRWLVFQFRHIPGTRTPAAVAVRGREYPLELSGRAYLDPQTGTLGRIDAEISKDMQDVGLRSLKVQVIYSPVQLPGWNQMYRFPSEAVVELESLRQHWRNVHRFSNYQRFTVDTEVSVSKSIPGKDDKQK
jgi:hypothetical protein